MPEVTEIITNCLIILGAVIISREFIKRENYGSAVFVFLIGVMGTRSSRHDI